MCMRRCRGTWPSRESSSRAGRDDPMATMTLIQAIHSALAEEMERNPAVVLLGEDIVKNGGVFRATEGLWERFGPERVIDTPLAESGIVGMAIGMALYGLRPIAEIQFADFIYPAFEQIVSELAKFRYRSAGQFPAPVVIRAPSGGGIKGGLYHSQSPEAYFIHTAGLKVVMPSTPADGKGLLTSAMRDPDPVIFFEPKALYRTAKGEVPEVEHVVPLGKSRLVREGTEVSVITYGAMVPVAEEAAKEGEKEGVSVEIIDLRTLWPFDVGEVDRSVKKT